MTARCENCLEMRTTWLNDGSHLIRSVTELLHRRKFVVNPHGAKNTTVERP
jgi:hypothetical protein